MQTKYIKVLSIRNYKFLYGPDSKFKKGPDSKLKNKKTKDNSKLFKS